MDNNRRIAADDILRHARQMWNRDASRVRSMQTEDRDFREFFGCGVLVCLHLWRRLIASDVLPHGGRVDHLLWTLMFLKLYTKQQALCALAGGVDKETYRTWCRRFLHAIASLEPFVVSNVVTCRESEPYACHRQSLTPQAAVFCTS
jgi:hypothetical protein